MTNRFIVVQRKGASCFNNAEILFNSWVSADFNFCLNLPNVMCGRKTESTFGKSKPLTAATIFFLRVPNSLLGSIILSQRTLGLFQLGKTPNPFTANVMGGVKSQMSVNSVSTESINSRSIAPKYTKVI